jgi:hypothetical protein
MVIGFTAVLGRVNQRRWIFEPYGGEEWALLIDINLEENNPAGTFKTGQIYQGTGQSVLLFALKSQNAQMGCY